MDCRRGKGTAHSARSSGGPRDSMLIAGTASECVRTGWNQLRRTLNGARRRSRRPLDRQLDHGHALSRQQAGQEDDAAVGKLDRIVVRVWIVHINLTKARELSDLRLAPEDAERPVPVDLLGERKLGPGPQADRDGRLIFRRKAARPARKRGHHEFFAEPSWARCDVM